MYDHTSECQAAIEAVEKERAEWIARWPNYCRRCEGWGMLGPEFALGRHWPEGVSESCKSCLNDDKCPRCAAQPLKELETDERCKIDGSPLVTFECTACGWTYLKPDGCPPEPECFCWAERQTD